MNLKHLVEVAALLNEDEHIRDDTAHGPCVIRLSDVLERVVQAIEMDSSANPHPCAKCVTAAHSPVAF
jgi:hypothetical protein